MKVATKKRVRNLSKILLSLAKIVGWSVEGYISMGQVPKLWSDYSVYGNNEKASEKIRQEIYYLLKRNYIEHTKNRGLALTEAGLKKALFLSGKKAEKLSKGKYLIMAFDIPEKYKKGRDNLRYFLSENGFCKLQESVWLSTDSVYAELLEYIKKSELGDWINIFIVEKLAFIPDKVKRRLKL